MRAAAHVIAPPESVAAYIEDMVGELATMAEGIGQKRLATSLRLLAIEAARAVPESED